MYKFLNYYLRITRVLFIILQLSAILPIIAEALVKNRLDDFIQHYEVLDYSPLQNTTSHYGRVKRWVENSIEDSKDNEEEEEFQLNFKAHGKQFHLRLRRDTQIFSESTQVQTGNKTSSLTSHNLVEGYLHDEPDSKVYGSIQNGVFHGHIFAPKESFSIEKISRFSNLNSSLNNNHNLQNPSQRQHSIIYSHNDIENDIKGNTEHYGCGINKNIQDWMSSIQNAQIIEDELSKQTHYFSNNNNNRDDSGLTYSSNHSVIQNLLHEESNNNIINRWVDNSNVLRKNHHHRTARQISQRKTTKGKFNSRTTCSLYIRTDPTVWRQIEIQEGISTKNNDKDKEKIKESIISIIGQHVKALNEIFENTLFKNDDATFRNIRFEVRGVKIDTFEECEDDYKGVPNPFCEEHIDVSNFLDLHSRANHEAYCLSYTFSYRDFSGGVVGLAWVASTSAGGGICQRYSKYLEGSLIKHRSLNTGIITFLNYNRQLPPRLSQLTFAHEVGHNFGSPHDPDECQPGGLHGNYIMYASSTNGYLKNNAKFSECSLSQIVPVLNQVFNTNQKYDCFIETNGSFCGNHIIEGDEECDCGMEGECSEDCCFPRTTSRNSCMKRPNVDCSPSEGPCCNADTCGRIQLSQKVQCQRESECTEHSFCDGTTAKCPIPKFKQDDTVCNNGTQVCIEGECRGSICRRFGLKECYLSSEDYNDKRALCNVSCTDYGGQCRSTYDLNIDGLSRTLSLRPGAPCDNFKGYCDVFMKCRAVDEEGPLRRLKRLILNKHGFRTIHQWALEKWWAVVLMAIGFVIIMGLFIQCCAVHTPSSNPYMAKNLKFTETLRHPMNSLRRQPKRNPEDVQMIDYEQRYPLRDRR